MVYVFDNHTYHKTQYALRSINLYAFQITAPWRVKFLPSWENPTAIFIWEMTLNSRKSYRNLQTVLHHQCAWKRDRELIWLEQGSCWLSNLVLRKHGLRLLLGHTQVKLLMFCKCCEINKFAKLYILFMCCFCGYFSMKTFFGPVFLMAYRLLKFKYTMEQTCCFQLREFALVTAVQVSDMGCAIL